MVTKSFSATCRSVACSASVSPWPKRNVRLTPRTERMFIAPSSAQGKSRRLAHLKSRSLARPIRPMTMMPKMIWSVASSAWLSVIMWPMPVEAPISSATMT